MDNAFQKRLPKDFTSGKLEEISVLERASPDGLTYVLFRITLDDGSTSVIGVDEERLAPALKDIQTAIERFKKRFNRH